MLNETVLRPGLFSQPTRSDSRPISAVSALVTVNRSKVISLLKFFFVPTSAI